MYPVSQVKVTVSPVWIPPDSAPSRGAVSVGHCPETKKNPFVGKMVCNWSRSRSLMK